MKELELVPYPRLIQRAVSNYRASLADSSGRILFLAGPPRSGRTRLLDDIARAIPTIDHKPDLLAGAAVNGMLFVASSANTRARLASNSTSPADSRRPCRRSRRRNASVSRWATPGSRAGPPNTLAKRTGSSATMKRPRMRLNGPWRFGEAVKTRMRLRAFWPTSPAWRATRGGRIWRWRDIERPKDSKATRLLPTTGSAFSTGSRRSSQREILRKRGVTSDLLCAWPPNAGGRLAQHECSSRSASSTSKRDTFKTRAAG
jgi:hypothetical protein